ncbi:hypothetical protein [Pseudomonas hunanensis]|jgi:macrodomain Ter protein organizer (MatP/YcbG family)|uniref:hypothetical protein n=1 Tax=Pseudomonas hunanensis TaxID=1247546 RepID=UPI0030D8DC26
MRNNQAGDSEIIELEEMIRSWLGLLDEKKAGWAVDYLRAKGFIDNQLRLVSPREVIIEWSRGRRNSPSTVLLIRNMKAAWRQKQYRDGLAERKAYSFTLDVRVKQQLDQLARKQGKTISETLEGLIKKAQLKAEKADAKDRIKNPRRDW